MTAEDIRRINYIFYTSFRQFVISPHSLWVCYLLYAARTIKSIVQLRFRYGKIRKVLFVVPSANNKKSVRTIVENLEDQYVTIWGNLNRDLPWGWIYLRSWLNMSRFQRLYRNSNAEDRRLMRQYYGSFMSTSGLYKTFEKILNEKEGAELIVFSNDHTTACRSLLEVAEKQGRKTLYVQHASVTEKFPPLRFSYSFLDGKESLEKYQKVGKADGCIFLSGSPRFDDIAKIEKREKAYDVGIALNLMDNKERVLELCRYIAAHYSRNIVIRPHPRMKWDMSEFVKDEYVISDSKTESSFSFLSKVRVMIANESGIHLDAALMEVPSALYNFRDSEILDWYSYIKNGLIKVLHTKEEVVETLKDGITLPEENIRLYNAAFHTKYDGKVGRIVAEFIKKETEEGTGLEYMKGIMVFNQKIYYYKTNESCG